VEDSPANTTVEKEGILETISRFTDFAGLLRMLGAALMVAAMSAFLLQGWNGGNDTTRFYMLLSQSILLAGGGLSLSYLLKENKGARVFFGLSLLSITADMVTLGALIFSVAHWGSELGHYPGFASWKASSGASLAVAGLAGVLVLAPTAMFSFMVLARRSAMPLSTLFLFTNLLLLVPVRESWMVGALTMAGVLIPSLKLHGLLKVDSSLRTKEGYFAMAGLFAPVVIIIARSLWLYRMDALLEMMLAMTGFGMLRLYQSATGRDSRLLGLFSFCFAGLCAQGACTLLSLPDNAAFTVFGVIFAGLGLDITLRSSKHRDSYANLTGCVLAATQVAGYMTASGIAASLGLIAGGVGVAVIGRSFENRLMALAGAAMTVLGIGDQFYKIIVLVDFSNWATLAAVGTTAIVGASVLERHGAVIKLKCQQLLNINKPTA
jgi:hypothetical protein